MNEKGFPHQWKSIPTFFLRSSSASLACFLKWSTLVDDNNNEVDNEYNDHNNNDNVFEGVHLSLLNNPAKLEEDVLHLLLHDLPVGVFVVKLEKPGKFLIHWKDDDFAI